MGGLIKYQQKNEEVLPRVLARLKQGHPVRLKVNDPKARPSKRLGYCLLYIIPVPVFDGGEAGFVFAVEEGGCVTLPLEGINTTKLMMIGLGSRSAKTLKRQIASLFS